MTIEYGPLAPDSTDVLRDLEATSFHFDYQDEEWARDSGGIEPERSEVARDDGRVVGHTSAYSLRMAVPGAPAAAVAGVTWVSVALTHRRRGVMRGLMLRQLTALHEQQREPVAALWASEAAIYGRFGYGRASRKAAVEVPRQHSGLRVLRTARAGHPTSRSRWSRGRSTATSGPTAWAPTVGCGSNARGCSRVTTGWSGR